MCKTKINQDIRGLGVPGTTTDGKSLPGEVGKTGVEPVRLAARDPKSRLSANSSTSPEYWGYAWEIPHRSGIFYPIKEHLNDGFLTGSRLSQVPIVP